MEINLVSNRSKNFSNSGVKNLNKDYMNIINDKLSDIKQLITEIQKLENNYKEALRTEKEMTSEVYEGYKKESADDPYGEQLSPYDIALEKSPSKQDFIIKDKPEFYKKIQKTINYFKKITKDLEKYQNLKKEDKLSDKKEYFESAKKIVKIMFATTDVKYAGELFVGGMDSIPPDSPKRTAAIDKAFDLGRSLFILKGPSWRSFPKVSGRHRHQRAHPRKPPSQVSPW